MTSLSWQLLEFQDLSLQQLYDLLQLRAEVFVVEQNCRYADPDGWDQRAIHLLGYDDSKLVACARLFVPGVKRAEAVLGRVCSAQTHRKSGLGIIMLGKRLDYLRQHYPGAAVWTSLQAYRQPVYEKSGFKPISDIYDDVGIPHIEMQLQL